MPWELAAARGTVWKQMDDTPMAPNGPEADDAGRSPDNDDLFD